MAIIGGARREGGGGEGGGGSKQAATMGHTASIGSPVSCSPSTMLHEHGITSFTRQVVTDIK